MKQNYIIGIDQSTQGTKAMLFDGNGILLCRADKNHAQLVDERGWVEHNPEEIYQNTLLVVKELMKKSGVDTSAVACVGISNQRETAMAWNRSTGKPVYNAIVWQCARGEEICKRITRLNPGAGEEVRRRTGLRLSPYFSAAKLAWILEHVKEAASLAARGELCCGTMDSYLVYRLTKGREFRTDYSNASRTQLFHIRELAWDETLCGIFGIPSACLPDVTDSDGFFGMTDFEGILPGEVPIHGVMGDSHGALFGQGCLSKGMMKTTYGTGSSIMMNIGEAPIFSDLGRTGREHQLYGSRDYLVERPAGAACECGRVGRTGEKSQSGGSYLSGSGIFRAGSTVLAQRCVGGLYKYEPDHRPGRISKSGTLQHCLSDRGYCGTDEGGLRNP